MQLSGDQPQSTTTATLTLTGLGFAVSANITYRFKYHIIWQSKLVSSGLRLGLNFPAVTAMAATVRIPQGAVTGGVTYEWAGGISANGGSIVGPTTPAVNTDLLAIVEGTIRPSAGGSLVIWNAAEASGSGPLIRQGSNGILEVIG